MDNELWSIPNMSDYEVFVMPENKEKGSHDKWKTLELVENTSRKDLAKRYRESHKSGAWKIRLV